MQASNDLYKTIVWNMLVYGIPVFSMFKSAVMISIFIRITPRFLFNFFFAAKGN